MMENMNEMVNMELANESTTDLVEAAVESGSKGNFDLGGFLFKTAVTIGVWEGGKRVCKWGARKIANAATKHKEAQRIKQAKKLESEEVVVTGEVENIEATHPVE